MQKVCALLWLKWIVFNNSSKFILELLGEQGKEEHIKLECGSEWRGIQEF